MLSDCSIRISRLQNGYTVSITDPKIVKANDERPKNGECAPWRDPNVTYTFSDVNKAVEFIKENVEKAFPADEFSSTFDKAAKDIS
jgi:hypothetical protein